jgi:transposase-like protein
MSMRPVSVFAEGSGSEIERLEADLNGRWRKAARAVMVLLSAHGSPAGQIAALLECHPSVVRRWITRFNRDGLADRPRSGRPRLGGQRLTGRIAALLARLGLVDPAPDPAVPGLAAGQPAHPAPAGPAGRDLAAAQADRPRRPGP